MIGKQFYNTEQKGNATIGHRGLSFRLKLNENFLFVFLDEANRERFALRMRTLFKLQITKRQYQLLSLSTIMKKK